MLGREVEEGQERVAVLGQAFHSLGIFGAVFLGEDRDGGLGARPVRRVSHLAKVRLHVRLHRLRHLVQDVGDLMHPATLMPGSGEDLVERLPEAHGAVADGDLRRGRQSAGLQVNEQFAPALCTLANADLESNEFLLALGRGTDDHEHAGGIILHSRLEVDPVGPDVDVALGRKIVPLPALVVSLPFLL